VVLLNSSMIKSFIALPFKYKRIAFRSWCLFIYWHVLISHVPYKFWKNNIVFKQNLSNSTDVTLAETRRIVAVIESVGRHHFMQVNCLRRCMVQRILLNSLNITTNLVIGVKKQQGEFSAHCWLTHNNRIINDSEQTIAEYVVLEEINIDTNNTSILKKLF